jgi:hypothetical protein
MRQLLRAALLLLSAWLAGYCHAAEPKVRQFAFHYQFRVKGLQPTGDAKQDLVRVWLPCPSNTDCQKITRLAARAPAELSEHREIRNGNRVLYFETRITASVTKCEPSFSPPIGWCPPQASL